MKKLLILLLLSPMFLFSQKKVIIKGSQLSISSLAPMASFSIVGNNTGSPATPVAISLGIGLTFDHGLLAIDTLHFKDTIFAVNGLQVIGAAFNTIGLGGRLQQNTNISLANLYSLTIDSAQTGAGKGFRVNYGSDAGWDLSVRDSATGYWTRIPKGTVGQALTMLSTGGIGWGAGGGGGGGNLDATLALAGNITANRSSNLNNFSWTLNQTSSTVPIFNFAYTGVTPTNGYPVFQINPVIPTETTQTAWMINRINSAQAGGDGNEVITMGFNVAPNVTPLVAGRPAMFWAMESNYLPSLSTRLSEWHQEYVNNAGTNWRLSSYTVNHAGLATPDIDFYHTASRFYIKSPNGGGTQFSIGDFKNTASFNMIMTTNTWSYQTNIDVGGITVSDLSGANTRQWSLNGFLVNTIGTNAQINVVNGQNTQIKTGASQWPLRFIDGAGAITDLYSGGVSGSLFQTDLPAGNFTEIYQISSHLTTGYAMFNALNDASGGTYAYITGSLYAGGSGGITANQGIFRTTASGGMAIWADTGPIKFAVGSTATIGTIKNTGQWQFNNYGVGTFTGTATKSLSVDASGNVIETTPISGISWDATLAINNVTARNFEQDQAVLGTPQYYQVFKPANYNGTTKGLYNQWVDDSYINPDTRRDVVMSWHSYNYGTGGSRISTSDAAFAFKSEQYYQADGTTLFEFHLPEMIATDGSSHRLFSMYNHRPTGYTYLQSQIGSLSFRHHWDNSGTTDWFSVQSGDTETGNGTTGNLGSAQMTLSSSGAGAGQFVRFTMIDGIGTNYSLIASDAQMVFNGGTDLVLRPVRFLDLPYNVNFQESNYYSNGNVQFQTGNTTANKGYFFYNAGLTNEMFEMTNGHVYSWQPFRVVSNGATIDGRLSLGSGIIPTSGAFLQFIAGGTSLASINLAPGGVDPTTPNNGDLWYITNHIKFQDAGTTYELPRTLTATATLDFPSTTSTTVSDLTITVTGAAVGDAVSIGVPNGSTTATGEFTGWVSASNTVKIRYSPKATEDPASGTFKATVIK